MQKLKKTRRTHKTNIKKQNKKHNNYNHTINNRNTGYPAHEPPRRNHTKYLRRLVGWISCISDCFLFVLELFCCCFCFFMFCFVFAVMFSPSLLSFCIYNRTTHITTNNKQKHSKKNKQS